MSAPCVYVRRYACIVDILHAWGRESIVAYTRSGFIQEQERKENKRRLANEIGGKGTYTKEDD